MKNLFKLVCIITFLIGGFAFGQTKPKHDIKVIHCKKFTISVNIGVVEVGTEITGCLVKVDGWPIMVWLKQSQDQSNQQEYLYVEEREMMTALKIDDPKKLEDIKIIKSGIWDYDGVNYIVNPDVKYEVVEVEGTIYYALPIQKAD